MCQRSHTVIYGILASKGSDASRTGSATLAKLIEQTGGKLFHADSDSETAAEIDLIENDLQNVYRLPYRPKDLKHDGSFHRIVLVGSSRIADIGGHSEYYAPAQ